MIGLQMGLDHVGVQLFDREETLGLRVRLDQTLLAVDGVRADAVHPEHFHVVEVGLLPAGLDELKPVKDRGVLVGRESASKLSSSVPVKHEASELLLRRGLLTPDPLEASYKSSCQESVLFSLFKTSS